MQAKDFKGLSQDDAFKLAAKNAGVSPAVLAGLWQTESGKGVNMLSPAGARGHFQIMPSTQASIEKKTGGTYNPNDLGDALFMASTVLKENMQKFGTLDKALKAYNGGWDEKKWGNSETAAYVGKVYANAKASRYATGLDDVNFEETESSSPPISGQAFPPTGMPGRGPDKLPADFVVNGDFVATPIAAKDIPTLQKGSPAGNPTEPRLPVADRTNFEGLVEDSTSMAKESLSEIAQAKSASIKSVVQAPPVNMGVSGYDMMGLGKEEFSTPKSEIDARAAQADAWKKHQDIGFGSQIAASARLSYGIQLFDEMNSAVNPVDPSFDADKVMRAQGKEWSNYESTILRLQTNGADFADQVKTFEKNREDEEIAAAGGTVTNMAAGMIGMMADPLTWATGVAGMGASKALGLTRGLGIGSKLAHSGVAGAAQGALYEGSGLLGSQKDITLHHIGQSIFYGAVFGVAAEGGLSLLGSAKRSMNEAADRVEIMRERTETLNRAYYENARENLGPGASREQLANEMTRLSTEGITDSIARHMVDSNAAIVTKNNMRVGSEGSKNSAREGFEAKAREIAARKAAKERGEEYPAQSGTKVANADNPVAPEAAHSPETTSDVAASSVESPEIVNVLADGEKANLQESPVKSVEDNLDGFEPARESVEPSGHKDIDDLNYADDMNLEEAPGPASGEGLIDQAQDLADHPPAIEESSPTVVDEAKIADESLVVDKDAEAAPEAPKKPETQATREETREAMMSESKAAREAGLDQIADDAEFFETVKLYDFAAQTNKNRPINEKVDRMVAVLPGSVRAVTDTLIRSKNPLAAALGKILGESPTGLIRGANAIQDKEVLRRVLLGSTREEFNDAFAAAMKAKGVNAIQADFMTKHRSTFDRDVWRNTNGRREGQTPVTHPNAAYQKALDHASDVWEQAMTRHRKALVAAKVTGYELLPDNSRGYVHWQINGEAIRNMTPGQQRAYLISLTKEVYDHLNLDTITGNAMEVAEGIAKAMFDVHRRKALGDKPISASSAQRSFSKEVEEAIKNSNMTVEQKAAWIQANKKSTQSGTKSRRDRDMNKVFTEPDGKQFTLGDIMDHDMMGMLEQQANRVSGEATLARYNIDGYAGIQRLRRAITQGTLPVTQAELHAFDSLTGYILGTKVGQTAPKIMANLSSLARVVNLGGLIWAQIAETAQMTMAMGVMNTLKMIPDIARLTREAGEAMRTGKGVGFLGHIENYNGEVFSTSRSDIRLPRDRSGGHWIDSKEDQSIISKILSSMENVQAKLTLFRSVQSVQRRATAEMIAKKATHFIRNNLEDAALRDMGFSPDLQKRIKAEMDSGSGAFKFDKNGNITDIIPEQAKDVVAMNDFVNSIYRGNKQIIQEMYPGESGVWVESWIARSLLTFRSYSVNAINKQTIRQFGNLNVAKVLGGMIASMSIVLPIKIGQALYNSSLMEDSKREKFLERALSPFALARASMSYMAVTGMLPDAFGIGMAAFGKEVGKNKEGDTDIIANRAGMSGGLVSQVLPIVSTVDKLAKGLRSATSEKHDMTDLIKAMPGASAWPIVPFINWKK